MHDQRLGHRDERRVRGQRPRAAGLTAVCRRGRAAAAVLAMEQGGPRRRVYVPAMINVLRNGVAVEVRSSKFAGGLEAECKAHPIPTGTPERLRVTSPAA